MRLLNFSPETILEHLLYLPLFIISLSVHEWAHAWMAYRLGDNTAKLQGRLTLNPLVHIDPFGTILVPLFAGFFGWAKPVPFNAVALSRKLTMRTGVMLVALAGPMSNVVQAVLGALVYGVLGGIQSVLMARGAAVAWYPAFEGFAQSYIFLNCALAVFNLIPITPLDGSKVLYGVLPRRMGDALLENEFLARYGFIILMVLFLAAAPVAHVLMWPRDAMARLLFSLAGFISGLIA
jgi:Zn-dependent protease